jgi:hypothetical protein
VSGIFRGSEQEVVERTQAAERRIEQLEADLAELRVRRQFLTSLLAKQERRGWLPEAKGLLFGGLLVFAAPIGLVVFVSLLVGVFALFR